MRCLSSRGFSLIELAIVLVIVGLLISVTIRGSEMIKSAKIKSMAKDLRSYYAAIYTFLDRMGRLPGDTDKDGRMDDTNPFDELESQNLAVRKSSPYGSNYNIGWRSDIPSTSGNMSANCIYVREIPVKVARIMDDQLDDGLADNIPQNDSGRRTGNFRFTSGGSGGWCGGSPTTRVTVYYIID